MNNCLIRSALSASMGGLLFGFDTAVISGVTRALTLGYRLSPLLLGLTVSSALLGTIIGSAATGVPADRYGRRATILAMSLLYILSAVGCAFAWDWPALLFFRVLGGLAIGGSSVLGPMYIAEISPAKQRGQMVLIFQLNVASGVMLAYLSNYLIGLLALGPIEWRLKLGASAIPAIVFFLLVLAVPESPRWLAAQGREQEARKVLEAIREEDCDQELKDIIRSIDAERRKSDDKLFASRNLRLLFLAVSIAMFNQLSGINAVLYYLNDIFAQAGFTRTSGDLQAVAIGTTNLLFCLVAMLVIDRIGRRLLLLIGAAGTAACLAGIAAIFLTGLHRNLLLWLLVCFIACFSLSGPVMWVYLSELFPIRIRAAGGSLGSFTHWAMNALIAGLFPLAAAWSSGAPFAFFAAMMVVEFFTVLFFYPETTGIRLEAIEAGLPVGGRLDYGGRPGS
jgi:SP family arabinose:H+ symporter-like MFS transporter